MTTKQITKRVDTIWSKVSEILFDISQDETIPTLIKEEIYALAYHCKSVFTTLNQLPF